MASPTLNHPLFGPLLGLSSPNGKTIQYRNLKYASIPGRFRNPVPHPGPLTPLNHSLAHRQPQPAQAYDATKHGPSCPQHPGGWAFDLSLIGMGLEGVGDMNLETEAEDMDEFGCLHAVVTVPAGEKREGLPVVVFVHGGGFSVGSNSWPQYDLSKLVATSVDIGKPIIGVSVNYRLGPFGFLSSPELGSEGNLGLKDLVCAFKWIHTNISSFYGSPRNITALGESAGSILLSHLLHLPATIPPLFHSAILMSGDSSLRRARSPSFHAKFYQNFLSQLGLSSHPVAERIEVLKSMPARDMVGRLPMFSHWSPASGTFLPDVRLSSIANGSRGWCQRVVMGDNAHDGSILAARVQNHPDAPSRLSSAVSRHLSPSQGTELCEAFGLAGRLSTTQRREGLLTLGSEVRFYYPILCWEASFSSPSSLPTLGKRSANPVFRRYHFHVLNPLLGATQGLASHELDLAFLLGNFAGLEENCPGVGDGMRKLFVGWIGGETWGRAVYDSKSLSTSRKRVAVVGLEGVKWCSQEEYDVESRGGRGTMLREWDVNSVFKVAESLQGVGEEMEGAEVVKGKL